MCDIPKIRDHPIPILKSKEIVVAFVIKRILWKKRNGIEIFIENDDLMVQVVILCLFSEIIWFQSEESKE